jgi:elongation factor P
MVDGEPFYIVEFQHVKPGKGGAFVRTKLKSYLSGNVLDRTFRSGERFEEPDLEEREMQFLYATGQDYTFMDTDTYEQLTFEKRQLGENEDLLKENMNVKILVYEHRPIDVELPIFIELKVVDADPGVRGDTASGGTKPPLSKQAQRLKSLSIWKSGRSSRSTPVPEPMWSPFGEPEEAPQSPHIGNPHRAARVFRHQKRSGCCSPNEADSRADRPAETQPLDRTRDRTGWRPHQSTA